MPELGWMRVVTGVVIVVAVSGLILVSYWRFRRGKGVIYRRYIPGLILLDMAALLSLAGILARRQQPPAFTPEGLVAVALGVIGVMAILRERYRGRKSEVGRTP